MKKTNNNVILLTGCINPNGMTQTVLQNPEIRKEQYIAAIGYYLSNTQLPIVFVENSNTDISSEFQKEVNDGRIEFVVFNGNDFNKKRGKGYGEALMIQYALEHSVLLNRNGASIVKITGRLICQNINSVSSHCSCAETVYGIPRLDDRGRQECISQVYVAPKFFYTNYFLLNIDHLNDSENYWFEHLLYDSIQEWRKDGHPFKEICVPLYLKGISGSNGTQIGRSRFVESISFYLHYLLHRFNYYGPSQFWKLNK